MKKTAWLDGVWIVTPAYNEAKYIKKVLQGLRSYTTNIIVVDDGSRDTTSALAAAYTPHVLRHIVNLGKGAALKTGCTYAFSQLHASAVILLDGDDQHDVAELPSFLRLLASGQGMIFGQRHLAHGMPKLRQIGNELASHLIALLFGTYIPDIPSGYKAFTRKTYQQILWQARDYGVEMEIAARVAKNKIPFSLVSIKTIYHDFDRGMTLLDVLKMSWQLVLWKGTL